MKIKKAAKILVNYINYYLRGKKPSPILFDHLPKCGGYSVNFYLKQNFPLHLTFQTGKNPHESVRIFKTLTENQRHKYQLVIGHLSHELRDYANPDIFKVTVLREPIDRIISHYFYVKQKESHYLHKRVIEENITLADFTTKGLSTELTNWYTSHFSGMSPQAVSEDPSKAITLALKTVLNHYDLIGFQDDIHGFLESVQRHCGLEVNLPQSRMNVTKTRKSVEDLSEIERINISKSNAADIELFALIKDAVSSKNT